MRQMTLLGPTTEPVLESGQRVEQDYYPTPEALTQALIDRIMLIGRVHEPCAGNGAIVDVLKRSGRKVTASDLSWEMEAGIPRDATTKAYWDYWQQPKPPDWVVTNPPFNCADEILEYAWEACTIGVAFLLRLTFLEPAIARSQFLKTNAGKISHLISFNPRPQFRRGSKSTDSCTVGWMVWQKTWNRGAVIDFVTGWR